MCSEFGKAASYRKAYRMPTIVFHDCHLLASLVGHNWPTSLTAAQAPSVRIVVASIDPF